MKNTMTLTFLLLAIGSFCQRLSAQKTENRIIQVDGKNMSYKTFNMESRKENEPILVFEHGLGGGSFEQLFPFLPKSVSGIQYDRNGLGLSEHDISLDSDSKISERLHSLLKTLNVKPPYLLVGHSIGGPYIRMFSSKYPEEVSGLIFIDPTDFMLTAEENVIAKKKSESSTSYMEIWSINLKTMLDDKDVPESVKADVKRAQIASIPTFFKEYQNLPLLKNIPATVIISYGKPIEHYENEMNKKLGLDIKLQLWWREYDDLRIKHYSDLIRNNDNSKLVLLPKYSHGIHFQNPELVAKLIVENFNSIIKK